jgi:hypothetical protein
VSGDCGAVGVGVRDVGVADETMAVGVAEAVVTMRLWFWIGGPLATVTSITGGGETRCTNRGPVELATISVSTVSVSTVSVSTVVSTVSVMSGLGNGHGGKSSQLQVINHSQCNKLYFRMYSIGLSPQF